MSLVSGLAVVTAPRTLIDPLFPCSSRRLLEQQSTEPPRGAAQQQHSGQPQQQLGLPGCEHDYRQSWGDSFLSGVHLSSRGDHDEHGRGPRRAGRPIPARRRSCGTCEPGQAPRSFRGNAMADNARQTGPALEAHRQFLKWLVPTVEKFPRSQKFMLGDRIQGTALRACPGLDPGCWRR